MGRCGGHCEELPRYVSFKEGSLVSDAGRFVVTGLQLPASSVIVPVAECLTQGHIFFWSGPHPITDRCDCLYIYLHVSGEVEIIIIQFQSCSLGSGDCLLSLYYRSAFSSVQPCFFSPLFGQCWSPRHSLIGTLYTKLCLMVCFSQKLGYDENRYFERKTKINPQII